MRYKSDLENHKNSIFKIKSKLNGNLGTEVESLLVNIIADLDTSSVRNIESTK